MALHKNHFQLVKCRSAAVCWSDRHVISCVTALGWLQRLLTNEDSQTSILWGNMWSVSLSVTYVWGRYWLLHHRRVVYLGVIKTHS